MADEATFSTLPKFIQLKIDQAMNYACSEPPLKKRKVDIEADTGGGFVAEDTGGGFLIEEPDDSGGGFIVDDDSEERASHIPLSSIPNALIQLGLPPNDDSILSVFENAASGWTNSNAQNTEALMVSRGDWRSVCAVLLEQEEEIPDGNTTDGDADMNMDLAMGMQPEGSEYNSSSDDGDDNDDEYVDAPVSAAKKREGMQKARSVDSDSSNASPKRKGKRREINTPSSCLEDFALFFPSLTPESPDLLDHKIMIKDIQYAAKILGEKIKAEEMLEMLSTFSSAPDKSMNYSDFQRMMGATGLA